MSKELTPQKEAGCPAAFPDEPPLSPKKEFFRIRHELGQLLKHAREQERLSAQAIAEQNGLSGTAETRTLQKPLEIFSAGKLFRPSASSGNGLY